MTYEPRTRILDLQEYHDLHAGESCAVLGNGPSLLRYDLPKLTCMHLGVNRSWKLIRSPYHVVADIAHLTEYYADNWDTDLLFSWRMPHKKFTDMRTPEKDAKVLWIDRQQHEWILSPAPQRPWSGYSGITAIELAVWMGFNPIYLLGYDLHDGEGKFYHTNASRQGERHKDQIRIIGERLSLFPEDVMIYNCNEESALDHFPYRSVDVILG